MSKTDDRPTIHLPRPINGPRPLEPQEVALAVVRGPGNTFSPIYNFSDAEAPFVEAAARNLLEACMFARFKRQLEGSGNRVQVVAPGPLLDGRGGQ